MHPYPTDESRDYYFFKDGKLYMKDEPGSICFIVPGDTAWKSDLEALRLLQHGISAPCSLESVVAKYLINEKRENY